MHIALTADPELPVPPRLYGGIERIIDLLAHGLVVRGHQVTLFAHADSQSAGSLVAWPGRSSTSYADTVRNAATLTRHVARERFDIVHSFSRLAYLTAILPQRRLPKLMSYHRSISPSTTSLANRLAFGSLQFTAISRWMISAVPLSGRWHVVPNGVPLDIYDFQPDPGSEAPLVFLGRIEPVKGPHIAIEVAQRTQVPLVIAGNVPAEHEQFFQNAILPNVDDRMVRYVGSVDDVQKNVLLGGARALLMPVLWEEPFGLVMTEAMACGTPVIGLRRGGVPEVVEHGVTGYVCDDTSELVEAVGRLPEINRAACRARVKQHYVADVMIDRSLEVYEQMCADRRS